MGLIVDPKIDAAQFTSSSISTRNLPSFQGLQLSTVKVGPSVDHLGVGSGLSQRALRGLVASKVVFSSPIFVSPNYQCLLLKFVVL